MFTNFYGRSCFESVEQNYIRAFVCNFKMYRLGFWCARCSLQTKPILFVIAKLSVEWRSKQNHRSNKKVCSFRCELCKLTAHLAIVVDSAVIRVFAVEWAAVSANARRPAESHSHRQYNSTHTPRHLVPYSSSCPIAQALLVALVLQFVCRLQVAVERLPFSGIPNSVVECRWPLRN